MDATPEEHKPPPPHRLRGFWIAVIALLALNWLSVLFIQRWTMNTSAPRTDSS